MNNLSDKQIQELEFETELEEIEGAETEEEVQEGLNLDLEKAAIVAERKDFTISSLCEKYHKGRLVLQPDYQRRFVWDQKKASNLIESLLLNIPVPPIFVADNNGKWEVIDGQQRLVSIFGFLDNKFKDKEFKLSSLQILSKLSRKSYAELPENVQDQLTDKDLSVVLIRETSDKNVKFEMFNRLNTNITKLNNQELRNCLYRGVYNNFIKEMAQNETFKKLINRPEYETRMLTEELVLSFFVFLDMDYRQYKGGMKRLLNANMEKNQNIPLKLLKDKEEKFKKSVDIIKAMFRDGEAFRVFSYDEKNKRYRFEKTKINQGLYLILMYWFSIYSKEQIIPYLDVLREELLNLQVHNDEFRNALTGSGTNNAANVIKKFDIWGESVRNIIGYPRQEPRCFSYALKEDLFKENSTCALCKNKIHNVDDSEVDHICCYSKGGQTIPENARLVHRYCNRHRGNKN